MSSARKLAHRMPFVLVLAFVISTIMAIFRVSSVV